MQLKSGFFSSKEPMSHMYFGIHRHTKKDMEPFRKHPDVHPRIIIIIIIMAEMAVFYMAGYLIEERRRWPVITASPHGLSSFWCTHAQLVQAN